jgi:hypothetical protein
VRGETDGCGAVSCSEKGRWRKVEVMADEVPKVKEFAAPQIPVNLPVMYANGFVSNIGTSDVSIILLLDTVPTAKLHMSYTAAKSLANLLTNAVSTLEGATSHAIMTSADVESGLRAFSEGKK